MFVARRFVEVVVTTAILAVSWLLQEAVTKHAGSTRGAAGWFRDTPAELAARIHRHHCEVACPGRSERAAHGGRLSEHFQFEADPRQPVLRELCHAQDSCFRRSERESPCDRTGRASRSSLASCSRRISTPRPRPLRSSWFLVRSLSSPTAGRLELCHLLPTIERQARVLRLRRTARPARGRYLERVVVNLLGGPGESDVFLDDLEITPVPKGS